MSSEHKSPLCGILFGGHAILETMSLVVFKTTITFYDEHFKSALCKVRFASNHKFTFFWR